MLRVYAHTYVNTYTYGINTDMHKQHTSIHTCARTHTYIETNMQAHKVHTNTVNDESLAVLKFGESAKKSIWRKKVWRNFHPRSQVIFML